MATEDNSRYNYQYGAAAPKYPYHIPQPTDTPEFEPLRRPTKRTKPKTDLFYGIKVSMCGLAAFSAAIMFVGLTSHLSQQQRYLRDLTAQIREVQSQINSTQAIIAANLDLEKIQLVAKEQLGMSEPLPHQVVYLELPQESYTSYNE